MPKTNTRSSNLTPQPSQSGRSSEGIKLTQPDFNQVLFRFSSNESDDSSEDQESVPKKCINPEQIVTKEIRIMESNPECSSVHCFVSQPQCDPSKSFQQKKGVKQRKVELKEAMIIFDEDQGNQSRVHLHQPKIKSSMLESSSADSSSFRISQTLSNKEEDTLSNIQQGSQNLKNRYLFPNEDIRQKSSLFEDKIAALESTHNIRVFLSTPIPKDVVFWFQVHVFTRFMSNQYQLWLCHGQQMKLLMLVKPGPISIDKTFFNLFLSSEENKKLYIGCFVSNFTRNQYTLFDENYPGKNAKMLATLSKSVTIESYRINLYIPKKDSEQNKAQTIYATTISNNLENLYVKRVEEFHNKVQRLNSKEMQKQVVEQANLQFQCKKSKKTMFIADETGQIKMFIGKKQSRRYKVMAAQGVSPLQVLATLIFHHQN